MILLKLVCSGDHFENVNAHWYSESAQGVALITTLGLQLATAPAVAVMQGKQQVRAACRRIVSVAT